MNFYKRFIGDYAADTRHLSVIEHGAYTLLLDFYYSTEKNLPHDVLKFMVPRTEEERVAFCSVLTQFFTHTKRGYSHTRCAKEIKNYKVKIETYRVSGRKGGINRQAIAKQSPSAKSDFRLENQNQNQNQNQNNQSQIPARPRRGDHTPEQIVKIESNGQARRAREASEDAISKESRIGAGPVCDGPFRPEIMERIRQRELARKANA
jgi:uncharacterized protein YdaU (DUF1376 family)